MISALVSLVVVVISQLAGQLLFSKSTMNGMWTLEILLHDS